MDKIIDWNMKCLVTKLQEVVKDNSLTKLGEIRFAKNKELTYAKFKAQKGTELVITAIDGTMTVEGVATNMVRINENGLGLLVQANTGLSLMSKYDIAAIQECLLPFNMNDLKYCELSQLVGTAKLAFCGGDFSFISESIKGCTNIEIDWYEGTYSNLTKLSDLRCEELTMRLRTRIMEIPLSVIAKIGTLKTLQAYGDYKRPMLVGDVSSLSSLSGLTSLSIALNNVVGDIKSLSTLVNCKRFSCEGNPELEGTLESLIEGLRSKGAKGEVYFDFNSTKVTYNGSIMSSPVTVTL